MGAFGAALIARERYQEGDESTLLQGETLSNFSGNTSYNRCGKCGNHCLLTVNAFSNGETFISGNRCERGLGLEEDKISKMPNLYAFKYNRTFDYKPIPIEKAKRGTIGIPRVLNMYDNYPFWFTLLTELGFRVVVSDRSSKRLYEKGLETIPSEAVCYPAKLSHGHIINLLDKGITTIFYPSIVYEKKEYKNVDNHFNCPIVISYAEVVRVSGYIRRSEKSGKGSP